MSLIFGAANSDRVTAPPAASINDLTAFTVLVWNNPTTLTNQRVVISKFRGATNEGWELVLFGTTGDVMWEHARASQYMVYRSNNAPLSVNAWSFLAATEDQAAGTPGRIYSGGLNAAAAEVGYSLSQAGSGAFGTDNARSLMVGNRDVASPNQAFQGRSAVAVVVARVLTLGEIIDWQFDPRVIPDTRLFWELGYNGVGTQPDWSGNGNHGTVTGATLGDHVPLRKWRRQRVLYVPVAAASGGAQTANLSPAVATATGKDVAITLGGITASLTPAIATATGRDVTITGQLSVNLSPAIANALGLNVSVTLGQLTVALASAVANATGLNVSVTLGAITAALSSAIANATGRDVTVTMSLTAGLSPAIANASALDVNVTLSGVANLSPAVANAIGRDVTIVLGSITAALSSAIATAIGRNVTVTLGGLLTALSPAVGSAVGRDIVVTLGQLTALLTPAMATAVAKNVVVTIGVSPLTLTGWVAVVNAGGPRWSIPQNSEGILPTNSGYRWDIPVNAGAPRWTIPKKVIA